MHRQPLRRGRAMDELARRGRLFVVPRRCRSRCAPRRSSSKGEIVRRGALAAAAALECAEVLLTELDAAAGDGDLGASMTRGAAAIRALPEETWSLHPSTVLTRRQTLCALPLPGALV